MKAISLILGHFCVLLSILGILLPLLPTTPFLLLAVYLYSSSSKSFHNWLIKHKKLGPIITNWKDHRSIPFRARSIAIAFLCINITVILNQKSLPFYFQFSICILLTFIGGFVLSLRSKTKTF